MNLNVMGAIIGLAKTSASNLKTKDTDRLICEALQDSDNEMWIDRLHEEKYKISPGCRTCTSPCGNTDDYDLKKDDISLFSIKEELLQFAVDFVNNPSAYTLIEEVLCFCGYDLDSHYFDSIRSRIQCFQNEKSK